MRAPLTPPEPFALRMGDGYQIRGRFWPNRGASRAAVIYLHGIQSHGGWYEWSGSVLANAGTAVLMPDRRGSGLSAEARGDVPSLDRWLLDFDELADWLVRHASVDRIALVGVSWGGKLAAAWAARNPLRTGAVMLIAPGLFPRVGFGALRKGSVALAMAREPTRLYPIPLSDPVLFTDRPAGQAFIRGDPLKLDRVTARFLYLSTRLDRTLVRLRDGSVTARCTLVLAGRDRIIRNEPTERWARAKWAAAPEVVIFHAASHTIEFEEDVSEFRSLLERWCSGLPGLQRV